MNIHKSLVKISSAELYSKIYSALDLSFYVIIPVAGNSMYPLLKHQRDSVMLKKCKIRLISKGDIVLYKRSNGQMVLHRVVKVNEDSFDMCGDAQIEIERGVSKDSVIAVMTKFYKGDKEISCNHFLYRLYVELWNWLRPFRKAYHSWQQYWRRHAT